MSVAARSTLFAHQAPSAIAPLGLIDAVKYWLDDFGAIATALIALDRLEILIVHASLTPAALELASEYLEAARLALRRFQ